MTEAHHMNPGVLATIAAIYGALLLATAIVYVLVPRLSPGKDHKELKQRTNSWWVIVTLLAIAVCFNIGLSIIFIAFLCFLALKEFLSLIPTRRADRRVLFWAYLSIPLQFYWIYTGWYGMFIVFIPVYVFLFLTFRMVLIGETAGFFTAVGMLQWGLMLNVFCISHLAFLLQLHLTVPTAYPPGPGLVLYIVLLTELNDVAQFCWGKLLGKRKIIPKVSPNKTWEGFLGGVATTILLSYVLGPLLTPLRGRVCFEMGLIVAVCGFIGDVVVSAVKRDLGVKDSGSLIPGHGGILDRIDSLTFTAPIFFHFMRYFY